MGYAPEAEGGELNFTAKRLNSKLQHSQLLVDGDGTTKKSKLSLDLPHCAHSPC
jgi:hypothetical protein